MTKHFTNQHFCPTRYKDKTGLWQVSVQPGDGTCFFHSVNSGLIANGIDDYKDGHELREAYVDWVRQEWQKNPVIPASADQQLQDIVKTGAENNSYKTLEDFEKAMRGGENKGGAWGGQMDAAILTAMLRVTIVIHHNPSEEKNRFVNDALINRGGDNRCTIDIIHQPLKGGKDPNHYDLLTAIARSNQVPVP